MLRSFTAALLTCVFLLGGAEAQTQYTENGKTYYRPARISTDDLTGFAKLPAERQKLLTTALATIPKTRWLKYKFGGASPAAGGFDCSGAMYYTLRKIGYKPPRTSAAQYLWVKSAGNLQLVPKGTTSLDDKALAKLQPGDLLFWSGTYTPTDGRKVKITHVSIYLGKEKDGLRVMAGATKGRSYRGKRGDGYGVYQFKLPSKNSRSKFVGYGKPPATPTKTFTKK